MNYTEEELKNEEFRDIPGYEGLYQVSDLGRVKSLEREVNGGRGGYYFINEKILKHSFSRGYPKICLCKYGKIKTITIHQLVAMAFLGYKPNKKLKICVDHKNNIKTDCRLTNLQLITIRKNNSKDKKGISKYTGVVFVENKSGGNYKTTINVNGKTKHLGTFDNEEEASQYYQDALICINENRIEDIIVKKQERTNNYEGVSLHKKEGKYRARITVDGKRKHLGSFNDEYEAHLAYQKALKIKNKKVS